MEWTKARKIITRIENLALPIEPSFLALAFLLALLLGGGLRILSLPSTTHIAVTNPLFENSKSELRYLKQDRSGHFGNGTPSSETSQNLKGGSKND